MAQSCSTTNCPLKGIYGPIAGWCTADVTDMSSLFSTDRNAALSSFNSDLTGWNTAKVTTMQNMFRGAASFNGDVSTWDMTSNGSMVNMFRNSGFNRDVTAWKDTFGSVTGFRDMFRSSSFNLDLCGWSDNFPYATANVAGMFLATSCPNAADPTQGNGGPFCFDCSQVSYIHFCIHRICPCAGALLLLSLFCEGTWPKPYTTSNSQLWTCVF